MIRLIATDLDGTLLNESHTVSERNKKAIIDALTNGIEVIVATGRSFPEAYIPLEAAELNLPYICINGAEIRDENKNIILETHLKKEQLFTSIDILEKNLIHYDLFVGDYIYTTNVEKQISMFTKMGETRKTKNNILKIRQAVTDRVNKGYIREVNDYEKVLDEYSEVVSKVLGMNFENKQSVDLTNVLERTPNISISSSSQDNIEITNVNAQKGVALKYYADLKGINMNEVMVVGDSYNDISMMRVAGKSVAMGNSPLEIKEICTHITDDNLNDGFASAIEDMLNKIK